MNFFKKKNQLLRVPLPRPQARPQYYPPPPAAPTPPPQGQYRHPQNNNQGGQRWTPDYPRDQRESTPVVKKKSSKTTFTFGVLLLGIVALGLFFGMKKRNSAPGVGVTGMMTGGSSLSGNSHFGYQMVNPTYVYR